MLQFGMFSDGREMSCCRGCRPRLRHGIRHPSCGWARESYDSARNALEVNSSVAGNIWAKDRSAATSCHDSHLGFRNTTADYLNRPNCAAAAAHKTAGFARRWSADWKPMEADPSAAHSNRIPPEHGHDRSYFPALPSCGCFPRSAAETTRHCPAHFLRRMGGWRLQRLRFRLLARSSDSARRCLLVRDWPKNDSARKRAASRHFPGLPQRRRSSVASAQSSHGWLPARLAKTIRLRDTCLD